MREGNTQDREDYVNLAASVSQRDCTLLAYGTLVTLPLVRPNA